MALLPPSPQTNVPRFVVFNIADAMLLDSRVKWIGIVYETTAGGVAEFTDAPSSC